MAVVADPEAVSFIAERGGRLYVYADDSDLKHVKTEPPHDPAIRFKQVMADGFDFYVEDDIQEPNTWNVKFHHLPWPHVDVLWDGHQPGPVFYPGWHPFPTGVFANRDPVQAEGQEHCTSGDAEFAA